MNTKNIQILIQLLLIVACFGATVFLWDSLPPTVPTQFKLDGTAGHYLPKTYAIFILPLFSILVMLLMQALPHIDPKVAKTKITTSKEEQAKSYTTFGLIIVTFFTCLFFLQLNASLYWFKLPFPTYPIIITLAFATIGNFFGKLRPNYFIGIRTPWALENETVWFKTHRVSGYIWVFTSLIMLVLTFIIDSGTYIYVFWVYLAIIVAVPILYSYLVYRKVKMEPRI